MEPIETILTLPPASARAFRPWSESVRAAFVTSDPPGRQLGSGGGTAHALLAARAGQDGSPSFAGWLAASRKLIVHGSGQSRRLPAYAAEGKPLLPLPLFPSEWGQHPDQRLLDVQLQTYRQLFRHAPAEYRVMVACGDVLLRHDAPVPVYPDVDVLVVGIPASPEEASHHGVMFCSEDDPAALRFFLQKPTPERIRTLAAGHAFFLDTGVWLFSAAGLEALLRCCGAGPGTGPESVTPYELFDRFATALGAQPERADPAIAGLRTAVLPLPAGRFYHFGSNRSVLSSARELAHPAEARRSYGHGASEAAGEPVILHASVAAPLGPGQRDLWIEGSAIPADWRLAQRHVLTGIPANDWRLALSAGVCIDAVDVAGAAGLCLRVYGFDDPFRGRLDAAETLWMGRPFGEWLAARGLRTGEAGLRPESDIQDAPLFPLLDPAHAATGAVVRWMVSGSPADEAAARAWKRAERLSATDLLCRADPIARQERRRRLRLDSFAGLPAERWAELVPRLDLEAVAREVAAGDVTAPPVLPAEVLTGVHDAMFRARLGGDEREAFARLRDLMVNRLALDPVVPRRDLLDDQIVWGRAPVRLDLAGGWTDTPPYCLEHGGRVVNMAVNLNGQPPIQVFARICAEPHIVVHSIDLGVRETIAAYEDLAAAARLGGGFGIARAALRLAGLDPRFRSGEAPADLRALLDQTFGGGIELSMLAAVPKGSGLGTSSILAATLLGTLGELCGLPWSHEDLFLRTLVLEQMLTSGGGWQDQVGGIAGGVKLVTSDPGLIQRPVVRWLPAHLLAEAIADRRALLYYTGLTRIAHNILSEIVRGIFLNDAARLGLVAAIGHNADFATDALQRQSWPGLCEAVRRSWALNQTLDAGTNPPAVQEILDRIGRWTAGAKLLGAGGGGYLLILAHDSEAGQRIRQTLSDSPPNASARFVSLSIAGDGFQVTRS
jgi:galactokinase/mevalonate kinase-like predicted kinase